MIVLRFIVISLWIAFLILGVSWIIFHEILPAYQITSSDASFEELLLVLNAAINTELDLWEKDVFKGQNNVVGTNSRYENYYYEITDHIISSLSPNYFLNMGKYITEDAVVSIIGRRVKIFLNDRTSTI